MQKYRAIITILKTYALAIFIFFIFRLILFFTQLDKIDLQSDNILTIFQAFLMGVRFDIVISSYLLILPTLILLIAEILNFKNRILIESIFYFVFSLFAISFMVCAADIPYFKQFFSRFSIGAFEWMDSPYFVFKMIIQEPKYFTVIIPFGILVFLFYKILHRVYYKNQKLANNNHVVIKISVSLIFLIVIFVGIRGRVQKKSPIRIGTAYFCNNPFLNQMGLNPVFTLMRSYLDSKNETNSKIHLMDENIALKNVQEALKIVHAYPNAPIARIVKPDTVQINKPNVVLIIMEGMSAAKMKRHGNPNNLTPFLDSISYESIYFENIYSAGKHTHNGVFGTLFSFPSLFLQHTMKVINRYNGLSSTLRKLGYSTTYFTTHDSQFDNIDGFLHANDFEKIVSQKNYPAKAIKTALGVPDDFMFEFSMPILDDLNNENKPFFVTFMTSSDHGPYYIPEYFKPNSTDTKHRAVEYADWSLRKFISLASKHSWFSNTIFVFVADHGAPLTATYEISLDYHHSPLIYYSPKLLKEPKSFECIGGQIDVFPTLMGILKLPYINNTLGIDLIKEKRPYIMFNDDDKIGVIDNEFLLIFNKESEIKLFKYQNLNTHNFIEEFKKKANEMEIYAKSNMQTYQQLLSKGNLYVDTLIVQ